MIGAEMADLLMFIQEEGFVDSSLTWNYKDDMKVIDVWQSSIRRWTFGADVTKVCLNCTADLWICKNVYFLNLIFESRVSVSCY
jgi:hypothetical protein